MSLAARAVRAEREKVQASEAGAREEDGGAFRAVANRGVFAPYTVGGGETADLASVKRAERVGVCVCVRIQNIR